MHWLNGPHVRQYYHLTGVTTPGTEEEFVHLWEQAQTSVPGPVPTQLPLIEPLPDDLQAQAQALQQTRQFKEFYKLTGVNGIVAVELGGFLLTPQVWVDDDYVDELSLQLPAENDPAGLFDFCFAQCSLGHPALFGGEGVLTSRRRDIGGVSPLRLAKHMPDRVTVEFDLVRRPNWPSIAVIQEASLPAQRILIRNGVHHLLALLRAGRPRAFCFVQAGGLGDVGLNFEEIPLFKPNRILAPRPPLLRDYLDTACARAVRMRDMDQVFRFGVNCNFGVSPR